MPWKIPFNEFPQTRLDARDGRIAQQLPSLRDVSVSGWHVPRHRRKTVDGRLFPKSRFNSRDYLVEFDGFTFSEIKDIKKRSLVLEGGNHPLDNVFDVSEVPPRSSITVDIDRFSVIN